MTLFRIIAVLITLTLIGLGIYTAGSRHTIEETVAEVPVVEVLPPIVIQSQTPMSEAPQTITPHDPKPEALILPETAILPEPVIIESGPDDRYSTVNLFFATNRVANANAPLDARFTAGVGNLVYGQATVSIPLTHERGVLETQGWLVSLIASPNPEKHVIVQELGILPTQDVLTLMNGQADAGNRAVLAYVHGYNTSFDKAARRAGQMTYDLGWDGASFFFSWPSQAKTGLYFTDDTAADQSVSAMKQVLIELGSLGSADRIVLIAHSMGTRVLSEAIQQLVAEDNSIVDRITTIVLAAPDIDKHVFINDIAPRFNEMAETRVTLYASAEDTALMASRAARGFARIGDTSDGLVLVDGIEIVDATGAESDFFGHTYFGDSPTIIDDIYDVVHGELPADERPMLTRVTREDGRYWAIRLGR